MKGKFLRFLLLSVLLVLAFSTLACNKDTGGPAPAEKDPLSMPLRLIVPTDWELEVGDSRSVDYSFTAEITDRNLDWTAEPADVASVDKWGRVTAKKAGIAYVTAKNPAGVEDTVLLNVVDKSAASAVTLKKVDYSGNAVSLGTNMQKIVTRYPAGNASIPANVQAIITAGDYTAYQNQTTAGNVTWEITAYGVLRTDNSAANANDKLQRFMGDRYFYSADTSTGKVLGIVSDGENGIWTIMTAGVTRIEMKKITGADKAAMMVEQTQEYVMRHGYVAESYYQGGDRADGSNWKGNESDNDGLWTSMYAAGEVMRYATMKKDPTKYSSAEIAAAKSSATISTEAVLLLSNLCMRTGTTEAYVRYQPNGRGDEYPYGNDTANGRYLSANALEKDGDASVNMPNISPAAAFEKAYTAFLKDGEYTYMLDTEYYLNPYTEDDWSNPVTNEDGSVTYETRTRNLEGYIVRTYSVDDEHNLTDGYIHYDFQYDEEGNLIAVGTSTKTENEKGYYLNGENLRGVSVLANGTFPTRLWDDLKDAGEISDSTTIDQITYKGDTSSDEIIGHLFLYKLAFDVLGAEDAGLKEIIASTMDRFAQHVSDNSYMMVDASGQPGTWSKFNRSFFYNSSQMGGAPLTSAVCLCIFKLASYVTGNAKWENEYRMAALDPSYEYAKLTTQYAEQCYLYMMLILDDYVPGITEIVDIPFGSKKAELMTRFFLNYSDEEMAMLAFYILFQLETDETLLSYYRDAIDDWWISIKYSENPLWYYIYQLAYPDKEIKDAYGNEILGTAAWALSRHPIDTVQYSASVSSRDDVAMITCANSLGGHELSYSLTESGKLSLGNGVMGVLDAVNSVDDIVWDVAAADERALHKFNGSTYRLDTDHNTYCCEGSTTYTLPFWMGMYHGMLTDIE